MREFRARLKRFFFFLVALAVLLAVHSLLVSSFSVLPQRITVRPQRYDLDTGQSIPSAQLERYRGTTAYAKETTVRFNRKMFHLSITNGNYGDFIEAEMTSGSWFTDRASEIGINVAVFSEDTAFSLFGTVEAVGNSFEISGIPYRVCGVYAPKGFWSTLSSDGRETIYLPLNSGFDRMYGADIPVREILLPPQTEGTGTFTETEVMQELRDLSTQAGNYQVSDFSHAGKSIRQPMELSVFLLAILLAILLLRAAWRMGEQMAEALWKNLREKEFRYTIRDDVSFFAIRAVLILVFTAAAILFLMLARFELYIPSRFFPSESILDFGFYRSLITDTLMEKNLMYAYKPSGYEIWYGFALKASWMLAAGEAVVGGLYMVRVRGFCFISGEA